MEEPDGRVVGGAGVVEIAAGVPPGFRVQEVPRSRGSRVVEATVLVENPAKVRFHFPLCLSYRPSRKFPRGSGTDSLHSAFLKSV